MNFTPQYRKQPVVDPTAGMTPEERQAWEKDRFNEVQARVKKEERERKQLEDWRNRPVVLGPNDPAPPFPGPAFESED
ncbi:MAG TPA: hypothetical protein PLI98_03720 [Candidatus Hydrogenedentes bacterium]|nr:hypothetical protein [Candidatus Hydrogenedentota bacterium]